MDRPPPRRTRPPPGPPPRGPRRRPPAHNISPGPANSNSPAPRAHPPPRTQNYSSASSPRPRSKNRRRRGNGGPGAGPQYNNANGSYSPNAPPPIAVKLVIRKLPPTLTAEMFAQDADAAGASKAVWRSFVPGSASAASGAVKRLRHVTRHAVAYLAFSTMEDAVAFSDNFNGKKFEDPDALPGTQPHQFNASVERAPWQAVPPLNKRIRPSPLRGTIENDSDYLAFLERLEEETKKEVSRAGALTVAQTTPVFPVRSNGAASASPSASETGETAPGGVFTSKGKVGAVAVKGSELITPLMEDVRARRKERDQKKKTAKPPPRPPKGKGRQVVVVDPATKQTSEPPRKGLSSSSRRKKQRERARAAEMAGTPKKQEDSHGPARVNGSIGNNSRRGSGATRRDVAQGRPSGVHANSKQTSSLNGSTGIDTYTFAANGKGGAPRGGIGRSSRPGRGGRPRAPHHFSPASSASGSTNGS